MNWQYGLLVALVPVWLGASIASAQVLGAKDRYVGGLRVRAAFADIQKIDNTQQTYEARFEPAKCMKMWDASNIEEIKDHLMDSMYKRVKENGLRLCEVPYQKFVPDKDWLEAAEKYAPGVSIGPDDYLVGYKAGVPFPVNSEIYGGLAHFDINDPQQGLKLAHNHDQRWQGDNFNMYNDIYITDSKGNQRRLSNTYSRYRYEGRVSDEPKPVYPEADNPGELRFKEIAQVLFPFELKGLFSLQHSFMDRNREDDFWLYIPSLRRVRRASAAQRLDTFAGTDLAYEDFMGFNGFVADFTYKVVAQKDLYLVRHQRHWPPQDVKRLQFNPFQVERTPNAIVFEQYPKNPEHIYSKRVFYYDPEDDTVFHWEAYDRKGNLWKSFVWGYNLSGYGGDGSGLPYLIFAEIIDYLNNHATLWPVRHEFYIEEQTKDYYTIESMKARGR